MTTVDTLETVYVLTDRFSSVGKGIIATTEGIASAIGGVMNKLMSFQGLLVGGGLFELGKAAVSAQGDWEQMRETLIALSGSAELADRKMQFIRQLAEPATFTTQQLLEAGTELEAFGLRIEHVLPTLAKLGGAFKADQEHLEMLVRIFGEVASGRMPEMRALARFGLNRNMLAKEGVRFSNDNQLLDTPLHTLQAFERIIERRYGTILERMAGKTNSVLASLSDAWQGFLRAVGTELARYGLPLLNNLIAKINELSASGKIEEWGKRTVKVFNDIRIVWEGLTDLFAGVKRVWDAVIDGLTEAVLGIAQAIQAVMKGLGAVAGIFGSQDMNKAADNLQTWIDDMRRIRAQEKRDAEADAKKPKGEAAAHPMGPRPPAALPIDVTKPSGPFSNDPMGDAALDQLMNINLNTRAASESLKDILDYKKYAFGGGPLAQMGITPVEVAQRGRQVQVNVGSNRNFERAIADMINDTITQLRRQGAF